MRTIVIIPARYASKRLPGKPLAMVAGISLLERVWHLSKAAEYIEEVYIATDDQRIKDHSERFDGKVLMTPASCKNGSERAAAALDSLTTQPDAVINMQGDAVLTPPWVITAMAKALTSSQADLVTPSIKLDWNAADALAESKQSTPASGTLVVTTPRGRALYFSKNMIPYVRNRPAECPYQRHIGLYGYKVDALKQFIKLPESNLEQIEGLEQLRALENGMSIDVVPVDYQGRSHGSIDSPEDIIRVEKIIATEGELLPSF